MVQGITQVTWSSQIVNGKWSSPLFSIKRIVFFQEELWIQLDLSNQESSAENSDNFTSRTDGIQEIVGLTQNPSSGSNLLIMWSVTGDHRLTRMLADFDWHSDLHLPHFSVPYRGYHQNYKIENGAPGYRHWCSAALG